MIAYLLLLVHIWQSTYERDGGILIEITAVNYTGGIIINDHYMGSP